MVGILDRASWVLSPIVVIEFPTPKLHRAFGYCPGLDEDRHGEFSQLGRLDELCILDLRPSPWFPILLIP